MKRMVDNGIRVALCLGLAAAAALGQSSSSTTSQSTPPGTTPGSSLGDYARQVRKDTTKGKPKVFDNDNLPTEDKLSIVGQPAASPDNAAKAPETAEASEAPSDGKPGADAKPAADAKAGDANKQSAEDAKQAQWKQWSDKIKAQQQAIELANRELDVAQREYKLRAAAMYGDVGNRLRNSADWDKQDAQYKQQIDDKQKAVEDAKQKLEEMEEDARKAGVPSSYREP